MFQDDIYPPAYAGVPSMSADDWLGGMNKDPVTVSFTQGGLVLNKPPEAKKDAVPTKKVEAAKSKSPAIDPENMTPMQAKVHAYEKRSSSTELRSSSRGSGSVSPPAVTSTSPPVTTSVAPRQEPQSDAEVCACSVCVCACVHACSVCVCCVILILCDTYVCIHVCLLLITKSR